MTVTALRPADVHGRGELRLALPTDAWVDVEAALEAVHRAESAVTQGRWPEAWGAAQVARYVTSRRFLAGHDAAWVKEWRRRLADVLVRSGERLPAADGGQGRPRQRRRGTPRLRAATGPAPGGAGGRAQPAVQAVHRRLLLESAPD